MIAKSYKIPYLRLFPIWTYGPIYGRLDGRYIRDGWSPQVFGERTYGSEDEACVAYEKLRAPTRNLNEGRG